MGRKINDGDRTGIKMDRLRNSRFEYDRDPEVEEFSDRRGANTISGPYAENRGRRSADGTASNWENSPYEDGQVSSWSRRQGWDQYYNPRIRGFKKHGGSQIGHDQGHQGRGPKGYKRSDESIFEDVCDMLARSADVDASEIEVSIKDGCVYLNGTVHDRKMKKMAEYEIENISGVRDVQNLLNLNGGNEEFH